MADNNGAIGWDEAVSEENAGNNGQRDDFVVLPDGEYKFTVNKVERSQHGGSESLPACNMVKVGVIVDGGDKGRSYVTTRFFMHTKTLWRIYQFMTAIGLHRKGDGATAIPWGKVTKGMTGTCRIKTREYRGETSNEIDKWLEPKAETVDTTTDPF